MAELSDAKESTGSPGPLDLIQIIGVTKTFKLGLTDVQALRGLSLRIDRGGMVALMGPSGSGKSTLLNLIGALDTPTNGQIIVTGQNLADLRREAQAEFRNATIGFIFQTFNLVPVLSALENVTLPAYLRGSRKAVSSTAIEDRAKHLLAAVGLAKQTQQRVNRLSGGQMQRVAIARALMNKAPLILADEPTANLDRDTAESVLSVLKQVCEGEGATVVVATHDPHVVEYCRRVVKLSDGQVVTDQLRMAQS